MLNTGIHFSTELLLALLPLILLQTGLALFCVINILRKGVQNLSKPIWILICLFFNLIGPAVFLIVGRRKEY